MIAPAASNPTGFAHAAGLVASVPPLFDMIYGYAWFVGFALAALVYLGLTRRK